MIGSTVRTMQPVRLRATPGYVEKPDSDVLTTLPADERGKVLGGPVEQDGLRWWHIVAGAWIGWAAESAPNGVALLSIGEPTVTERDVILRALAAEYGVDERLARATLQVESGGSGFRNGRLVIRFEPHVFLRRFSELFVASFQMGQPVWDGKQHRYKVGGEWRAFHGDQDAEYAVQKVALDMARRAGFDAASYGAGQVMGFNHDECGHDSAEIMAGEFQSSEEAQLRAMFEYFRNRRDEKGKSCLDHLRAGDLVAFAGLYNGTGQAQHYAGLIQQAMGGTRGLDAMNALDEPLSHETDDDVTERLYELVQAVAAQSEARR